MIRLFLLFLIHLFVPNWWPGQTLAISLSRCLQSLVTTIQLDMLLLVFLLPLLNIKAQIPGELLARTETELETCRELL